MDEGAGTQSTIASVRAKSQPYHDNYSSNVGTPKPHTGLSPPIYAPPILPRVHTDTKMTTKIVLLSLLTLAGEYHCTCAQNHKDHKLIATQYASALTTYGPMGKFAAVFVTAGTHKTKKSRGGISDGSCTDGQPAPMLFFSNASIAGALLE